LQLSGCFEKVSHPLKRRFGVAFTGDYGFDEALQVIDKDFKKDGLSTSVEAFRRILLNRGAGNGRRASDRITDHAGLVGEETALSG